jgi:hypothetical protein
VLVIEFLYPLDATDSALELGRQLLTTQLKYIHTYACYFDLKPDNIKKRPGNPTPKYFIIDMNLSKELMPDGGFRRLHFTPLYSSQTVPRSDIQQFSCYVNDFIELSFVMHQMIAQRAYESKTYIFKNIDDTMRNQYNRLNFLKGDFVADPDRMMKNPIAQTRRGWLLMKALLEYPLSQETRPFTEGYVNAIYRLPKPYAPSNIHEILAASLKDGDMFKQFMKTTQKTLVIECSICSKIGVRYKCPDCYNQTTPLCSDICFAQHECK